jgi:hypothetical protein
MRPMAAAAVGALIAGVGMYAVGARAQNSPFAEVPALVQTVDGQFVRVPGAQPVVHGQPGYGQPGYAQPAYGQPIAYGFSSAPAPAPVIVERQAAPRTVYQTAPAPQRVVVTEQKAAKRSWKKTAMVVGGSAAGGAGVGAVVGGKKGALIGAALGGGAASIYEATKR